MKQEVIDFIGIGVPRCGTTWIANCLSQHPQVLFSGQKSSKEIGFFNSECKIPVPIETGSDYFRGKNWYLNQFPVAEEGKIRGEFSVMYYWYEKAPQRIKSFFPGTKIIAILRDPVEMIYSTHWYASTSLGFDASRDFSECVEQGYYLDLGLYFKHLKKYFEIFPRENILIVILDDIKQDPGSVTKVIYDFLGVDSDFIPDVLETKSNVAMKVRFEFLKFVCSKMLGIIRYSIPKSEYRKLRRSRFLSGMYRKIFVKSYSYSPMDLKLERKLRKFFLKDIEKLEKLIDKDLDSWK